MHTLLRNCTGIILAGGENRRMPVPKAFIEVGGKKIVERNLNILKQLFNEIFIITNEPESYAYLGVPLLGDVYDIRGPMTGIFTALLNASNQWVFISACDMPFIKKGLIEYMASKRDNHDAVIPKSPTSHSPRCGLIQTLATGNFRGVTGEMRGDYMEPLFAFYSRRLLVSMEKNILTGKRGIKDFLSDKRVQYVKVKEIKKIDPELRLFINLNTPEDVDFYLQPKDKLTFKRKVARR